MGVGAIRRTLRLATLGLWSLGWFLAWAAGTMLVLPIPAGRRRVRRTVFGSWARGVTRILGVELTVAGARPVRPFLVVSNHLSYLDVVVLAERGLERRQPATHRGRFDLQLARGGAERARLAEGEQEAQVVPVERHDRRCWGRGVNLCKGPLQRRRLLGSGLNR